MSKVDHNFTATLVFERNEDFNESAGPVEMGKVGVCFGDRVFWTGAFCFPGDTMDSYNAKVSFAKALADRWNAALGAELDANFDALLASSDGDDDDDGEESFADRARQAEINAAMGEPTDDDWLTP